MAVEEEEAEEEEEEEEEEAGRGGEVWRRWLRRGGWMCAAPSHLHDSSQTNQCSVQTQKPVPLGVIQWEIGSCKVGGALGSWERSDYR